MALQYRIVPVTPFEQNCSILWCDETRQAAIVDPGGDLPRILAAIKQLDLTPQSILLTHAHIDHAGAAADLAEQLKLPIIGPQREDQFWIDLLPMQSQRFGFAAAKSFEPTRWLEQGDQVKVGNETLAVLHCPGHTPGHLVFYHAPSQLAVVGDVLFKGSVGRSDFPRGDHQTLVDSIRNKLWPLGSAVAFIPGHGPMSTFGEERRSNPYVGDGI